MTPAAWYLLVSLTTARSYVEGHRGTLYITIYDESWGSDKFLGKVEIPVDKLIMGQPLDRWFRLQAKKEGKKCQGELRLYLNLFA